MTDGVSEENLRTEAELQSFTIGELEILPKGIEISPYDPQWPDLFLREERRIRHALGHQVRLLEHAGSTSVPGLAAKPKIDIVMAIPDSSDEESYAPLLETAGYTLRIREPEWFEHRVFTGPDYPTNIHVFTEGCEEIDRMLLFRDWLRSNDEDRDLYQRTKIELASRDWKYTQHYADSKSEVVEEIIARAKTQSTP